MPTHEQGSIVFGTPLGHEDFVAAHLESVLVEHHTFINRIPVFVEILKADPLQCDEVVKDTLPLAIVWVSRIKGRCEFQHSGRIADCLPMMHKRRRLPFSVLV